VKVQGSESNREGGPSLRATTNNTDNEKYGAKNRNNPAQPTIDISKGGRSQILARAAFWDKRVEEKIILDHLVLDQFPNL